MKNSGIADFVICMAKGYEPFRHRIMERFSLSAAEVDVLMFIANNPNYNTAAKISKMRMIPKSHVSLAVSSLAEKGLLTKKSGDDRRSILLLPSDKAESVIAVGRELQNAFQESLFLGFSAEERAVLDSMHEKIRKNLENIKKSK